MMDFKRFLKDHKTAVDRELDRQLPAAHAEPAVLHEAMRYSVLSNGKRLRPILILETCRAFGGDPQTALPAAAAVECVHCFSLIHDDLPLMDDDDLRRGIPTCHVKYGDAVALLAGDALLAQAFEILADPANQAWGADVTARLVYELAAATTGKGLCGGQTVDILAERGEWEHSGRSLQLIHERKTGALLTAAVRMGAIIGGADPRALEAVSEAAYNLGLAFQVRDDLLDIVGDQSLLGKAVGRDQELGKLTYPALYGLETSGRMAEDLHRKALDSIDFLGERGETLRRIFNFIVTRNY